MGFERVIAYEAWCDEPGCSEGTETFLPAKHDTARMQQARDRAREQGWYINRHDAAYCPEHAYRHRPRSVYDPLPEAVASAKDA